MRKVNRSRSEKANEGVAKALTVIGIIVKIALFLVGAAILALFFYIGVLIVAAIKCCGA